jgi:CheY-like chemotaxis protein
MTAKSAGRSPLFSRVLYPAVGYSTIEASDGPAGMRVLQSPARIDLLITDVGLPNGLNGVKSPTRRASFGRI